MASYNVACSAMHNKVIGQSFVQHAFCVTGKEMISPIPLEGNQCVVMACLVLFADTLTSCIGNIGVTVFHQN